MNLRKFSFMVSVVLLLSVLLSACAGAAPTAAPDKPADSSGGAATGGEKVLKLGAAISETGQVSREGKFLKDGYEFWILSMLPEVLISAARSIKLRSSITMTNQNRKPARN